MGIDMKRNNGQIKVCSDIRGKDFIVTLPFRGEGKLVEREG